MTGTGHTGAGKADLVKEFPSIFVVHGVAAGLAEGKRGCTPDGLPGMRDCGAPSEKMLTAVLAKGAEGTCSVGAVCRKVEVAQVPTGLGGVRIEGGYCVRRE